MTMPVTVQPDDSTDEVLPADSGQREDPFAAARRGLDAYGASASERDLVDALARHGQEEGRLLSTYVRFAEEAPSEAARYLVSLVLEDERRHHRLLAEIANAVGWAWEHERPVAGAPTLASTRVRNPEFRAETRALLREEQEDKRSLRKLRRKLGPYEDTTVWALLVDLMMLDTEKHARILKFILDHEA